MHRECAFAGGEIRQVTLLARQPAIANVVPGKGLCVLIDALCRLPAESWRLQIVGSLTMDRRGQKSGKTS